MLLRFACLHSQLLVCKVNGIVFILNSDILLKLEEFADNWLHLFKVKSTLYHSIAIIMSEFYTDYKFFLNKRHMKKSHDTFCFAIRTFLFKLAPFGPFVVNCCPPIWAVLYSRLFFEILEQDFLFNVFITSQNRNGETFLCLNEQGASAGRRASTNHRETMPRYGFPKIIGFRR